MPTEKDRITVSLDDEDYQWVGKKSDIVGSSRAGVVRQLIRGVRLGRPELLAFGDSSLVFAEQADADSTGGGDSSETESASSGGSDGCDDEPEESVSGIEAFRTSATANQLSDSE